MTGGVRPGSVSVDGVVRVGPCRLLGKPQPPRASVRRQPSAAGGVLLGRCPGVERRPQRCSAPGAPPWSSRGVRGASPRSLAFRTRDSCVASVSGLGPRPRSGMGAHGLQRRPGALRGRGAGPGGGQAPQAGVPVSPLCRFSQEGLALLHGVAKMVSSDCET